MLWFWFTSLHFRNLDYIRLAAQEKSNRPINVKIATPWPVIEQVRVTLPFMTRLWQDGSTLEESPESTASADPTNLAISMFQHVGMKPHTDTGLDDRRSGPFVKLWHFPMAKKTQNVPERSVWQIVTLLTTKAVRNYKDKKCNVLQ